VTVCLSGQFFQYSNVRPQVVSVLVLFLRQPTFPASCVLLNPKCLLSVLMMHASHIVQTEYQGHRTSSSEQMNCHLTCLCGAMYTIPLFRCCDRNVLWLQREGALQQLCCLYLLHSLLIMGLMLGWQPLVCIQEHCCGQQLNKEIE
jgi:hypothetical protein